MQIMHRWLPLVAVALLITSCGYRFGQGAVISQYRTVTVPFVEGDRDGTFTAALVEDISRSGCLTYHCEGGELILYVTLLDLYDENVGYRYDRKKESKENDGDGEEENGEKEEVLTHSIIPIETRVHVLAEVTLVEACSGCEVLGPVQLHEFVDFDHDYYFSREGINVFSLGQVNDIDTAHDDVFKPLSHKLAQKIVDYINAAW